MREAEVKVAEAEQAALPLLARPAAVGPRRAAPGPAPAPRVLCPLRPLTLGARTPGKSFLCSALRL